MYEVRSAKYINKSLVFEFLKKHKIGTFVMTIFQYDG